MRSSAGVVGKGIEDSESRRSEANGEARFDRRLPLRFLSRFCFESHKQRRGNRICHCLLSSRHTPMVYGLLRRRACCRASIPTRSRKITQLADSTRLSLPLSADYRASSHPSNRRAMFAAGQCDSSGKIRIEDCRAARRTRIPSTGAIRPRVRNICPQQGVARLVTGDNRPPLSVSTVFSSLARAERNMAEVQWDEHIGGEARSASRYKLTANH